VIAAEGLSQAESALGAKICDHLDTVHAHFAAVSDLEQAASEYRPTAPPTFLVISAATNRDRLFLLTHELCHMHLHPPGSSDRASHESPDEERQVHEASRRTCERVGVNGYLEALAKLGAKVEPPRAEDEGTIQLLTMGIEAELGLGDEHH